MSRALLDEPHEELFAWLKERLTAPRQVTLVHGDFRNGNIMVSPETGLAAVLDWELAHLGDPIEDRVGAGAAVRRLQVLDGTIQVLDRTVLRREPPDGAKAQNDSRDLDTACDPAQRHRGGTGHARTQLRPRQQEAEIAASQGTNSGMTGVCTGFIVMTRAGPR